MEHYRAREWQEYVFGSVDAGLAEDMEQHLAQCAVCLDLYLEAAENSQWGEVSSQFTEAVLVKLPKEVMKEVMFVEKQSVAQSLTPACVAQGAKLTKQSLGNYAIAACLTLLLTAGGIFGGVASAVPQLKGLEVSFTDKAVQKVGSGWSEEVAEKTLSILDIVKPD